MPQSDMSDRYEGRQGPQKASDGGRPVDLEHRRELIRAYCAGYWQAVADFEVYANHGPHLSPEQLRGNTTQASVLR